ncbi:hypothetical protein [Moraxella bovoculi]|uniref:hypothetical protein n=1 Tax=Moraxella bovoculi TaxID=386891 RepID=UPI000624CFB3|nr:hypothetical protein [Moraxella bovoculi]AKG13481.1 hypothetical protein AAX11_04895 [Moraxella bovoculi]
MENNTDKYSLRMQLGDINKEIKKLSNEILELTVLNKFLHEERISNTAKLDFIDNEVTTAKGAVSLIKWVISVFGVSVLGFGAYIVSAGLESQQKLINQAEKITILESRIDRNINDISRLSREIDKLEEQRNVY